jgi:hypothetical protein
VRVLVDVIKRGEIYYAVMSNVVTERVTAGRGCPRVCLVGGGNGYDPRISRRLVVKLVFVVQRVTVVASKTL